MKAPSPERRSAPSPTSLSRQQPVFQLTCTTPSREAAADFVLDPGQISTAPRALFLTNLRCERNLCNFHPHFFTGLATCLGRQHGIAWPVDPFADPLRHRRSYSIHWLSGTLETCDFFYVGAGTSWLSLLALTFESHEAGCPVRITQADDVAGIRSTSTPMS